jgi:hypothetical protein
VVNEDRDRPLRGQDVRGMPDHLLETMQPGSPIPAFRRHTSLRCKTLHESTKF